VGATVLVLVPEVFRPLQEYRMFVYGGILVVMMLVRRQGLLGGRPYSLRLTRFDEPEKKVYLRGDKFLPEEK
jgi:branched-chain amino acid transport system permease protein